MAALSTTNNLAVLRALMLERKAESTLEIGLSFGGSALLIAASHQELRHVPAAQHVAIDPYQRTVWDNAGVQSLRRAGLDAYVEVREQFSSIALAQLLAQQRAFDLVYVDGSHLFEDVFVDAYFSFRLLTDTGIALFDDCSNPHVAKVLNFVRTNWHAWIEEIDLSAYRHDGNTWRYRVGQHLGRIQLRAFRRVTAESRSWDSPLVRF